MRLLWSWLQDHCDDGARLLIGVNQIHGDSIFTAHNDGVTHRMATKGEPTLGHCSMRCATSCIHALVHLKFVLLMFVLWHGCASAGELQLPEGIYLESDPDPLQIKVKVMGGYVTDSIRTGNRDWSALSFNAKDAPSQDYITKDIYSINRDGWVYNRQSEFVFTYGTSKKIEFQDLTQANVTQADGATLTLNKTGQILWQDSHGDWKKFKPLYETDAAFHQARLAQYGDKNNVNVTFQYDASGKRTGVFDHFGNQVLWYEYDETATDKPLIAIRDATGRRIEKAATPSTGAIASYKDVLGNTWNNQVETGDCNLNCVTAHYYLPSKGK